MHFFTQLNIFLHFNLSGPRAIRRGQNVDFFPLAIAVAQHVRRKFAKIGCRTQFCSALSRELGINRTQFNRYLSGESFPRPDVLARICAFFETDPRILLVPMDEISTSDSSIAGAHMQAFMGNHVMSVDEDTLPSGFYRFSRQSFVDAQRYVRG